jgi:hypothetical protein
LLIIQMDPRDEFCDEASPKKVTVSYTSIIKLSKNESIGP